ncbi:unnamed protein product, partial [Darwinula stevensoni]
EAIALVLGGLGAAQDGSSPCEPRQYDYDSVVCVCTAEYCDFPGVIHAPDDTELYTAVTSSRDGLRFETQHLPFADRTDETTTRTRVRVNRQEEYQSLLGFGGAFTDAAGLNIKSLEPAAQELIIRSYFAPEGIRYNIGRI